MSRCTSTFAVVRLLQSLGCRRSVVSLAESYGMNAAELSELMRVAEKNKELIERYWN